MPRSGLVLTCLLAAVGPSASAQTVEHQEHSLVRCDVEPAARGVRDSSRVLADYLASGHSSTHPAAVVLATSMAEIAQALDSQLLAVDPTHGAFRKAWGTFDQSVRRSPMPRDPRIRTVLPRFKRGTEDLAAQLGCGDPAGESGLIPCQAIPLAHLLAVVASDLHAYGVTHYGDSYPEQAEAAGELARTAIELHQVLHDLEVAVPGAQGIFAAVERAFAGSSLTDTDDPEDMEVKSRLLAVSEAMAVLDGFVGACHEVVHQDHQREAPVHEGRTP